MLSGLIQGCGTDLSGGANLQDESILSVFGPPDPAQAAQWAADPYDADKRQRGMLLLANAPWGGEPVYLRFYRAALDDEDAAVRAVACEALGRHGVTTDAVLLSGALTDESPIVRRAAARGLQRIHNPRVVNALIRSASADLEDDSETRAAAVEALGQYAEPEVVQVLVAGLLDQRLLVNQAANDSLTILTGQDFGYDAGAWLQWIDQTDDLFAGRGSYVYPVYRRSSKFWEYFLPWTHPPNETASMPVGMTRSTPNPAEE
jgi:hypothetical protein